MITATSVSFATTVLTYFSPSKSPFYGVICVSIIALCIAPTDLPQLRWYLIAGPTSLILVIAYQLSNKNLPEFNRAEGQDQLRFARSFSLCSAILTLVLVAKILDRDLSFTINLLACLTQCTLFLVLAWAHQKSEIEQGQLKFNFVQLTLITSAFLIGGGYCIAKFDGEVGSDNSEERLRYLLTALLLYMHWLACCVRWARYMLYSKIFVFNFKLAQKT